MKIMASTFYFIKCIFNTNNNKKNLIKINKYHEVFQTYMLWFDAIKLFCQIQYLLVESGAPLGS
jgi:hypothetical protein